MELEPLDGTVEKRGERLMPSNPVDVAIIYKHAERIAQLEAENEKLKEIAARAQARPTRLTRRKMLKVLLRLAKASSDRHCREDMIDRINEMLEGG